MKELLLLGTMFLTACHQGNSGEMPQKTYGTVCVKGVVYYTGYHTLAVKIDHKTLKPVRCENENY